MSRSLTQEAMGQQFDLFCGNQDPDRDIRPLLRSVTEHWKSGTCQLSDLGPMFGILWFYAQDYGMGWFRRFFLLTVVRIFHLCMYRRPLWNDFYMCLWMLSRDQKYVCELHHHLYTAIRKHRFEQAETGQWMINSMCEQSQTFKSSWNLAIAQHGELFS